MFVIRIHTFLGCCVPDIIYTVDFFGHSLGYRVEVDRIAIEELVMIGSECVFVDRVAYLAWQLEEAIGAVLGRS